jgi:hypothetical protein
MTLQTTRNKLCIVYEPIAVWVHYIHEINTVLFGHGTAWDLLDTYLELIYSKLAISILIKLWKGLSKVLNLILWDSRSNEGQGCALEILWVNIVAHVLDDINWNSELFFLLLALSLDPRMIEGFFSSASHVSLPFEELIYQIFRFVTDLVPDTWRKVKGSIENIV